MTSSITIDEITNSINLLSQESMYSREEIINEINKLTNISDMFSKNLTESYQRLNIMKFQKKG